MESCGKEMESRRKGTFIYFGIALRNEADLEESAQKTSPCLLMLCQLHCGLIL